MKDGDLAVRIQAPKTLSLNGSLPQQPVLAAVARATPARLLQRRGQSQESAPLFRVCVVGGELHLRIARAR